MKKLIYIVISLVTFLAILAAFHSRTNSQEQMVDLLKKINHTFRDYRNDFSPETQLAHIDSTMGQSGQIEVDMYVKANTLLKLGEEEKAIVLLNGLIQKLKYSNPTATQLAMGDLALAYLRLGEQTNCVAKHSAESCILPIQGGGIHSNQTGSQKAIALYEEILKQSPDDIEARWLLNLAYMTLGKYPQQVPKPWLIPNMVDTTTAINPFQDVAKGLKLDVNNMAGGNIIEDFDHDGYLDVALSAWGLDEPMHYFKNNADGTFTDRSKESGLQQLTGGLNIMQTDYNNDGFADIFVLRGAWQGFFGNQPNSLLKNNGDGTFTDVTTISGLLSFHPTQTATWTDFNNDGWLDVFIGNETANTFREPGGKLHPCELYMNNQDGTFREVADLANCNIIGYVKGVTSGDYNNDGWKDLFLSTMDGNRYLLKNKGLRNKEPHFEDVSAEAGLRDDTANTFTTWFWDYDNDGWLDLFVCDYTFQKSLAYYEAAEALKQPIGRNGTIYLYHNNHNGTFTNMSTSANLQKTTFSMGGNFGDINNDGFLDMYLGTGNPNYKSLVPNKLFLNQNGKTFADVTTSARVGHVQKGHGVAFADLDNDGDQDVYIEMGGAYVGDSYANALYLNPGQSSNNWICLNLHGTKTNRLAIGSRVKVTFRENGVRRSVYRDVNSGGSFGASPLRREIGIGTATLIDEVEVRWHGSKTIQVFRNIKPNQFLAITEGSDKIEQVTLKALNFNKETAPVCRTPPPIAITSAARKP
ncbi:CRTAC1 family protein [Spirosoma endbachense]|uniref:CRTAC1 family protein n=1 Tax=Spirosoma endbachense TaxID=2666025 RepID=A0A6P1W1W1_9BACT|nr:CRTAC1 family protein [Spirosoma endbachense]QHV97979.1 CRTAC1 family protein [Spirosoma endbachense]